MFCDWAQPSKLKAAVHHSGPLAVFTTLSASQIKRANECCWRHLAALWKADKYSLTFFLRGLISQITCLLWRRIWKVASSWTLGFQSEASMLQISGCFHTYSSCIIYSSLNQRSLVSWHRKKKNQTKICHYKPHEKAFWPDTGNAGTSCCVLDWWRTWNSIYIYLEKYFTCVCSAAFPECKKHAWLQEDF